MWCIDPFLGNDRETNNKTTAVTGQRILNKQQLNNNNNGTIGNVVFYAVCTKGVYNDDTSRAIEFRTEVCEERTWAREAEESSLLEAVVGGDTGGWKRLSGCCGDLCIVEISGGAAITCAYESCVSGQQSKLRL
jgi:hypothetical protein